MSETEERKVSKMWIPFWVDKWLFGSTRIELAPDERSVWLDLLAIASKNDGYIRANATTPYPESQLAGLLVIEVELLKRTIEKCIKYNKISLTKEGTYFVDNWDKYQLSKRHQRRLKNKIKENKIKDNSIEEYRRVKESSQTDTVSSKAAIKEFFAYYCSALKSKGWIKRDLQLNHTRRRVIEQRLKDGYTLADLKACVDAFVADDWDRRGEFIELSYVIGLVRGVNMADKWLNKGEKPKKPRNPLAEA
uniref:Putative DNA replication protein n=1 Tax=viral metagenome TaxID=1070528 RepID=A0A6M3JM83_9ZZZZ